MNWTEATNNELCAVILEAKPVDLEFQAAQYELGRRMCSGEMGQENSTR